MIYSFNIDSLRRQSALEDVPNSIIEKEFQRIREGDETAQQYAGDFLAHRCGDVKVEHAPGRGEAVAFPGGPTGDQRSHSASIVAEEEGLVELSLPSGSLQQVDGIGGPCALLGEAQYEFIKKDTILFIGQEESMIILNGLVSVRSHQNSIIKPDTVSVLQQGGVIGAGEIDGNLSSRPNYWFLATTDIEDCGGGGEGGGEGSSALAGGCGRDDDGDSIWQGGDKEEIVGEIIEGVSVVGEGGIGGYRDDCKGVSFFAKGPADPAK
ncbi:unnamed protein product [Sphagnum balticum]